VTTTAEASAKRRSRIVAMPARTSEPVLLAPFSTRLPPELLRRLRVAAPQLDRRIGAIAADALDAYLRERGL
jgi:hypothetical protein